jgi:membrane protease YdiL (CAAX protease family)
VTVVPVGVRRPAAAGAWVAAACALLLARPLAWHVLSDPTALFVVLFAALLVVSLAWPTVPGGHAVSRHAVSVGALGVAAFGVARLLGGRPPAPATARFLVLNALAAVAEEALFRRVCFGVLARWGAVAAVAGSAALFALVHVTVYGPWALPVDLAAGLVLGWQRLATGTWTVPALTHVVANVLVVI